MNLVHKRWNTRRPNMRPHHATPNYLRPLCRLSAHRATSPAYPRLARLPSPESSQISRSYANPGRAAPVGLHLSASMMGLRQGSRVLPEASAAGA